MMPVKEGIPYSDYPIGIYLVIDIYSLVSSDKLYIYKTMTPLEHASAKV